MHKYLLAALLFAPLAAQAAEEKHAVLASENCASGCVRHNQENSVIYYGAEPRTYRVCSITAWNVEVALDGADRTPYVIPGVNQHVRQCHDLRFRSIVLKKGEALAGPVWEPK